MQTPENVCHTFISCKTVQTIIAKMILPLVFTSFAMTLFVSFGKVSSFYGHFLFIKYQVSSHILIISSHRTKMIIWLVPLLCVRGNSVIFSNLNASLVCVWYLSIHWQCFLAQCISLFPFNNNFPSLLMYSHTLFTSIYSLF